MSKEKRTKLIDHGRKQILQLCSNNKNTNIRILLCKYSSKKFITIFSLKIQIDKRHAQHKEPAANVGHHLESQHTTE